MSEAPDVSIGVTQQALGPSPDTSCSFYSSAGRDYWFCDSERNWSTARSKCQAIGMDLATIESATENSFIRSHVPDDSWIGANDITTEGQWRWAQSGTQFWQGTYSGSAVGGAYTNWSTLQPNSSSEDCAIIDDASSARWSDVSCTGNREYVCEGVVDLCESDPNKVEPGQCGCGNPDTDNDNDGTANCNDGCVNDPGKTAPGVCGCGTSDADTDGDGAPTCEDACPNDFTKLQPGDCGCADAPMPSGTACDDGLCVANTTCNGAGACGTTSQCTAPDSDCELHTRAGTPYWFCDNDRLHSDARARCQSVGMDLVVIESAGEDAFVSQYTNEHSFIGGSDQATEGTWVWLGTGAQFWQGDDNGSAVGAAYTNWSSGEPDDASDDCVTKSALSAGKWSSHPCSTHDAFVCERLSVPIEVTEAVVLPQSALGPMGAGAFTADGAVVGNTPVNVVRVNPDGSASKLLATDTPRKVRLDTSSGRFGYYFEDKFELYEPDGTFVREYLMGAPGMALLVPGSQTVALVLASPTSHEPSPDRVRVVHVDGTAIEFPTPGLRIAQATPSHIVYSTQDELVTVTLGGVEAWRIPMALRDFEVSPTGNRLMGVLSSVGSTILHVDLATGAASPEKSLGSALYQLAVADGGRFSLATTKTDLFLFDAGAFVRQVPAGVAYVSVVDVSDQGNVIFGGIQLNGETLLGLFDSSGSLAWSLPGAVDVDHAYRPYVAFKPGGSAFVAVRIEGMTTYNVTGGP